MTLITELFTLNELERNLQTGMIRQQVHPEFPELVILNYTEAAQFSKTWNQVTRACRGLIYNTETLEVLARPFQKIHNWDETEAPRITWDAPLYDWSNKEDGSLGIMYRTPVGTTNIATRGSFASEQAIHATALIQNDEVWVWDELLDNDFTPLFEIIYPENRIVLDYGDRDELIYLGYIHRPTGAFYSAEPHAPRTFDDIRKDLSRENKEGWVVWLSPYKAVKIKQADYIELHRIVTGLNKKSIWRAIGDDSFEALVEQMPDELFKWAKETAKDIWADFDTIRASAEEWYAELAKYQNQKEFALNVTNRVPRMIQGLVFSLRAGKDINKQILKMIEPKGGDK